MLLNFECAQSGFCLKECSNNIGLNTDTRYSLTVDELACSAQRFNAISSLHWSELLVPPVGTEESLLMHRGIWWKRRPLQHGSNWIWSFGIHQWCKKGWLPHKPITLSRRALYGERIQHTGRVERAKWEKNGVHRRKGGGKSALYWGLTHVQSKFQKGGNLHSVSTMLSYWTFTGMQCTAPAMSSTRHKICTTGVKCILAGKYSLVKLTVSIFPFLSKFFWRSFGSAKWNACTG